MKAWIKSPGSVKKLLKQRRKSRDSAADQSMEIDRRGTRKRGADRRELVRKGLSAA